MADSVVDIALVFPELLGTYGDGGNALVLARRLARRGIAARIIEVGITDPIPRRADIYLLGGGEDSPQFTALDALRDLGRARPRGRARRGRARGVRRLPAHRHVALRAPTARPVRRARPGRRGHDPRAGAARRRGRGARRRARHRLARRLREPSRRHRARRRAQRRSGRASPSAGARPTASCTAAWSAPISTVRCSRATRASRISSSSGSPARSRRSPIRRPSCSTRSATRRSPASAAGHGGHRRRSST